MKTYEGKLFLILLLAFSVFIYYLQTLPGKSTLTQDELWGATLVNLSIWKAIFFVIRFDIHPPLYYLQLKLWALLGHSDGWLQLNAVAWLIATAALVWYSILRKYVGLAALAGTLLVLSNPLLVSYALEVRMYTFLSFVTVLGTFLSERLLERISIQGSASKCQWIGIILINLVLVYSYATGLLIVGAHLTYGLLEGWHKRLPPLFFKKWVGMFCLIGLLSLPVLANSMIRSVTHAMVPDIVGVISTFTELGVGFRADDLTIWSLLALILLGSALIGAAVIVPNARSLIMAYLVVPVIAALVVSYAVKPLWITRSFLFVVPIMGIAIGRFLGEFRQRVPQSKGGSINAIGMTAAIGVCVVQLFSSYHTASVPKVPNYMALATSLEARARSGDCVVALDSLDVFWGMVRYFVGTDWAGGLDVQAPPLERWATIMSIIPPWLWTNFAPRSDRFDYKGIHLIAGLPADLDQTCHHVFLVGKRIHFIDLPAQERDAPVLDISGPVTIRGPLIRGASQR